jgi:hypothetical protein
MPTGIVTETCPAPQCNLSEQDIEQIMDEMKNYINNTRSWLRSRPTLRCNIR